MLEHALGQWQSIVELLDALEEDDELVAAEARDDVGGTQGTAEPLGRGDEQPVAGVVTL